MKPLKYLIIIFFCITVGGTQSAFVKGEYMNPTEIILFNDGYENNTARVIKWTDWTPIGWTFNDISSYAYEEGQPYAYAELVYNSTESFKGNISAKHYAPHALRMEEDTGRIWWRSTYCNFMKRFYEDKSEMYVRWYVKFDTLPTRNWEHFSLFYMLGPKYFARMEVKIAKLDDKIKLSYGKMWSIDENGTISENSHNVPVNIKMGQWYCLEVYYKADPVNGEYRAWFEGEEIFSITNLNTTPGEGQYLPNGFDLGILNRQKIENYTVWTDEVLVATRRVIEIDPIVDHTIRVFNNKTGSSVHNAFVQLNDHQGYTNETGAVNLKGIHGFSRYQCNISEAYGYKNQIFNVDVFDQNGVSEFYLNPIPEGEGCVQIQAYKENKTIPAVVSFFGNTSDELYVTPFITCIITGPQNITARYGDQHINKTVDVMEGRTVTIDVEFPTLNGTLEIHSYRELEEVVSTVEISHHNNSIKKIVETPNSVELRPDTYQLNIFYANRTILKNITVGKEENIKLAFYFEPEVKDEYGYIRELWVMVIPLAMILGIVIFFKIK